MVVYCPKCGDTMDAVFEDTSLKEASCRRGNMELSAVAVQMVNESFFQAKSQPKSAVSDQFRGGSWYCPQDGARLKWVSAKGYLCPNCGRSMPLRLIRHLTEYHPHAGKG